MSNQELAKILGEMAAFLDMKEVVFKPRAYEHAAFSIQSLEEGIDEIYKKGGLKALEEIPGVGKGIAEKIEEFIKTGKIHELEKLRAEFPVDISGLKKVEGLGPKTIKKLYKELGIKDLKSLKKAAETGKLKNLEGLGEKSEERILKSIAFLEQSHGRFSIATALPLSRRIIERLRSLPEVQKAEFAGSIARMQETVGDLDILVISSKPSKVTDFFVEMPEVQEVMAKGDTKTSVRLKIGMDADLRVIPSESFGA